jgi:hypothetical protein
MRKWKDNTEMNLRYGIGYLAEGKYLWIALVNNVMSL